MEQEIKTKVNQTLNELRELVTQGFLTKEEIMDALEEKREEGKRVQKFSRLTLQQNLFFVGGFIVLIGVSIFISQFWSDWTQSIKAIFALGLSIFLYIIGAYLHYVHPKLLIFSSIAFIVSALLLPLGIGTVLDLVGISSSSPEALSINFAIISIIYFASYFVFRNDIFIILATFGTSAFYIHFTNLLFEKSTITFEKYRILILGLVYLIFGYYFESVKKHLVNIFYFVGMITFLGIAFALSTDNTFWLFLFPLILIALFFASVFLQNKTILALTTLFTFIEIGRLTSKYFSQTLGWPLALIIAGLGIIAIGYLSYRTGKSIKNT